jgi:hypothetical protein
MESELSAYIIGGDGEMSALPAQELLAAFDQLAHGSTTEGQSTSTNGAAVGEFVQCLKRVMHVKRDPRMER